MKRREQRAKKSNQTETLQTQIEGLRATVTAQCSEIERLQAVLVAFREPDAIDDQLLSQLCARPYDSAAINQVLSVPVLQAFSLTAAAS